MLAFASSFIYQKRKATRVEPFTFIDSRQGSITKGIKVLQFFSFFLHLVLSDGNFCENCCAFQEELCKYQKHNKNFTNGCINIKSSQKQLNNENYVWKGCSIIDIHDLSRSLLRVTYRARSTLSSAAKQFEEVFLLKIESSNMNVHNRGRKNIRMIKGFSISYQTTTNWKAIFSASANKNGYFIRYISIPEWGENVHFYANSLDTWCK